MSQRLEAVKITYSLLLKWLWIFKLAVNICRSFLISLVQLSFYIDNVLNSIFAHGLLTHTLAEAAVCLLLELITKLYHTGANRWDNGANKKCINCCTFHCFCRVVQGHDAKPGTNASLYLSLRNKTTTGTMKRKNFWENNWQRISANPSTCATPSSTMCIIFVIYFPNRNSPLSRLLC